MNNEYTLTGPLLRYDIPSHNGFVIPKGCHIEYPEKVPVIWDYKLTNPKKYVIGVAEIIKVENGLDAVVTSKDERLEAIINAEGRILCGGYFDHVKSHKLEDMLVVDSARMPAISVFLVGSDTHLYLERKNDDD